MTTRFTLYGSSASPPTYRVALFLRLAGVPYNYIHVSLKDGEQKSPEYLAKQRFGQVPLLIDHESGLHLVQSGSILQYLSEALGKFAGGGIAEVLQTREWIHWDWDALARGIFRVRGVRAGRRKMAQETVDYYIGEAHAALEVLETYLKDRTWMVGNAATIADIDIYSTVGYAPQAGYDTAKYPSLNEWIRRVESLPNFLGVDDLLPKESKPAS